ncbi:hypothetical protein PSTH1771_01660 [Pseudomonas syringae pv. theae]|uniref:bpX6 domain-containing protein n=1 Tax=Pseudomonas syringae TaxID=317 RepID=UPI0023BB7135|nr:bpX6 domain-containing protein [Pseudomonas syringae]GKS03670.1 hypothetical protein PSTH1771_01660 [Pseudomonas syringae pv. theae]
MRESAKALIRRPVLTGHQQIEGVWFPVERFSERTRALLILEQWQAGASAYRFAQGDLLRFRQSLDVICEGLTGWPLVRQGQTLCSALLAPEEMHNVPVADLWLVRGSHVEALQLRDAVQLAPGQWIDVSGYALLDTYDCRNVLPESQLELPDVETDVREILGGPLGPVSPEREAIMRELLERQQNAAQQPAPPSRGAAPPGKPVRENKTGQGAAFLLVAIALLVAGALLTLGSRIANRIPDGPLKPPADPVTPILFDPGSMVSWAVIGLVLAILLFRGIRGLGRMSGRPVSTPGTHGAVRAIARLASAISSAIGSRASARASSEASSKAAAPDPSQSTLPERASRRPHTPSIWRRWVTRLTVNTRLSALYGKRQAAYMRRMLDMFENGDLEEALRHAIPLGVGQDHVDQDFGTPERRKDLSISGQSVPGRAMLFEQELESHLKKVYRQTFERLDREGRIEEAVFVLAELLKVRPEALDYLEKHARFQQAADLALAWDMSASTIVRLLCLADNWQRALQVARRDGAFEDAVLLLQAKRPEIADRLRLEWAKALTGKGLWLQAVEVIWSLPAEREKAAQWLLAAEAAGGTLAVGALVKRAILLPDTLEVCGPWIEQLRNDPERFLERTALAKALLDHKDRGGALAWLAGATVHAIIADQACGRGRLPRAQLQTLVKMSKDKLLLADLPGQALPRSENTNQSLERVGDALQFIAPAMGSRAILDAVPVQDNRYLLALGEAGAVVMDAASKVLFHFPVPAQAIVLGHSRQVALVLARRDEVWRISKLDLVNRTARDLGVLTLDVFARNFDGTAWTIGRDRQLRVVDVDLDFQTLWHISDLPGRIITLRDDAQNECLWLYDPEGGSQFWHYRLPDRRLLSREQAPDLTHDDSFLLFSASRELTEMRIKRDEDRDPVLIVKSGFSSKGYKLPGLSWDVEDPLQISLPAHWLLVGYCCSDRDALWHFIHRQSDKVCAVMHWPLEHAQVRCTGNDWLLFDHHGRLSHIDSANASQHNMSIN